MPAFRPILMGTRFGRLVVAQDRERGTELVHCRCDCGTELTVAFRQLGTLTHSCGCLQSELTRERLTTHGMTGTKIYWIWADMIGRCTRPTHKKYLDYGGRGITVCEHWHSFESFYADMGDRPAGRSLDRTNNDLGYSPDNCRWATGAQQRLNQRPRKLRTSCSEGHPFAPEDTRLLPNGTRVCKICARERARVWRASKKPTVPSVRTP
jgi:hypothetical protein